MSLNSNYNHRHRPTSV